MAGEGRNEEGTERLLDETRRTETERNINQHTLAITTTLAKRVAEVAPRPPHCLLPPSLPPSFYYVKQGQNLPVVCPR